jgi:hypothetical protein
MRNLKGPSLSHVYIFEDSQKKEEQGWYAVLNISGARKIDSHVSPTSTFGFNENNLQKIS